MTNNKKNSKNSKGMPLNDSPVIFNLHDEDAINYVGRYIESEGMFLLSLNDDSSDFVPKSDVKDWWYVDEHPIIQSEVLKNKVKKKYRRKLDDSKNKLESNSTTIFNSELFTADKLQNLETEETKSMFNDFINDLRDKMGLNFESVESVNVRTISQDEFHTLPIEVLEQVLGQAEGQENWDLAIIIRDVISQKKK